jgi:hypothetical protein
MCSLAADRRKVPSRPEAILSNFHGLALLAAGTSVSAPDHDGVVGYLLASA